MLLYQHHRNSKLFFHPAKFDNFKDEKISDYKTVSVAQSKNLLDWKLPGLTNYEQLLKAVFFVFWGSFFFKYCSFHTKKLHNMKFKKIHIFVSKFYYKFQIGIVTFRTSLIQHSITYTQDISNVIWQFWGNKNLMAKLIFQHKLNDYGRLFEPKSDYQYHFLMADWSWLIIHKKWLSM